nr:uncharacterized protein LOC109181161 [Ipomoea batatas]
MFDSAVPQDFVSLHKRQKRGGVGDIQDWNTLFRSILTNSSTLSPSCKERVLATLLQNQELLDDLSTNESWNLLALAQGIRATPWPIEESDDEVNEADLQEALEASKKADNVSILTSLKSTVVRMEKVLLDDKKLLQSFEAGDVGSDSAPAR